MSMKRLFYSAISDMVALGACGALEYCLEQIQGCDPLLCGHQMNQSHMVCVLDRNGVVCDMNAQMLAHLGVGREQMVGKCVHALFPRDIARRRQAMIKKAIEGGETVRFIDRRGGNSYETALVPLRLQNYAEYDRVLCMVTKLDASEFLADSSDSDHVWQRVAAS
jgi:PAS domain S-box-containing protein